MAPSRKVATRGKKRARDTEYLSRETRRRTSAIHKPKQRLRRSDRLSRRSLTQQSFISRTFRGPVSPDSDDTESDHSASDDPDFEDSDSDIFEADKQIRDEESLDQEVGDAIVSDGQQSLNAGAGEPDSREADTALSADGKSIIPSVTQESAHEGGERDCARVSEPELRPDRLLHQEDTVMGNTATSGGNSATENSMMSSTIERNLQGDQNQEATNSARPILLSASGFNGDSLARTPPVSALAHPTRAATPTSGQACDSAGESSPLSAVTVFDSLKNIFHQPPGGKSKLPSFFTAFAAEYQKQEAEILVRDVGHETVRKEVTDRVEAAREAKLQAERELEKAKSVKEDFESKMVPSYLNLKNTSVKKHKLRGKAIIDLKAIETSEGRLRHVQQTRPDLVEEDVIEKHILQPFREFMRNHQDLAELRR